MTGREESPYLIGKRRLDTCQMNLNSESLGPLAPLALDPPHFEKRVSTSENHQNRTCLLGAGQRRAVQLDDEGESLRLLPSTTDRKSTRLNSSHLVISYA